jgi:Mg-chelatase subunit ChlI
MQDVDDSEDALRTRILFAREELEETKISRKQIEYICNEAARAGVQVNILYVCVCVCVRTYCWDCFLV